MKYRMIFALKYEENKHEMLKILLLFYFTHIFMYIIKLLSPLTARYDGVKAMCINNIRDSGR